MSWILTRIDATHAAILTSQRSTTAYASSFNALGTLPYHPCAYAQKSAASVVDLAPLHFRRENPRLVSYYAFFK